jgi:hypothetical protein
MRSTNSCIAVIEISAILIFGLLWTATAVAQVQPTNEFALELNRRGLAFDAVVFRDFTVVRVLPNPHFNYSIAVRHRTLPFEVRFATRELTPAGQLKEDSLREGLATTSIMNMSRKDGLAP